MEQKASRNRRTIDFLDHRYWWLRTADSVFDYFTGYVADDGISYSYGYNVCNYDVLLACVI